MGVCYVRGVALVSKRLRRWGVAFERIVLVVGLLCGVGLLLLTPLGLWFSADVGDVASFIGFLGLGLLGAMSLCVWVCVVVSEVSRNE